MKTVLVIWTSTSLLCSVVNAAFGDTKPAPPKGNSSGSIRVKCQPGYIETNDSIDSTRFNNPEDDYRAMCAKDKEDFLKACSPPKVVVSLEEQYWPPDEERNYPGACRTIATCCVKASDKGNED